MHAWATLFLYRTEEATYGKGDVDFLKRSFARLLTYFTWWLNQKDRYGNNAFEGGFLGLDNIGVFDRSAPMTQFLGGSNAEDFLAAGKSALYAMNGEVPHPVNFCAKSS